MAGVGGYQPPANPAPVSGPGALSQRTDGQGAMALPGAQYGEQAAFQEAQQAAPMASMAPLTPLDAPSGRPSEPVTAGSPMGAGPGPEALSMQDEGDDIRRAQDFLPALMVLASQPNASPQTRQLVRQLSAQRYQGGY